MPAVIALGDIHDVMRLPNSMDVRVIDNPPAALRVAAAVRALAETRPLNFGARMEHAYQQAGLRRWRHTARLLESANAATTLRRPAADWRDSPARRQKR